jgi:hypothetical protein
MWQRKIKLLETRLKVFQSFFTLYSQGKWKMENYRNAFTLFWVLLRKFRLIGDSLEHKPKARGAVLIDVLPNLAGRDRRGVMIWTVMKFLKSGSICCSHRGCSAASYSICWHLALYSNNRHHSSHDGTPQGQYYRVPMPSLCPTERLQYSDLPIFRFSWSSSPTVNPLPRFHFQWVPTFTPLQNLKTQAPGYTVADYDLSHSVSDSEHVEKNADLPMAQNCFPGPISR